MRPAKKPDVVRIASALHDAGVDWVLVGGMAMVIHGSDHVTTDIDFAFNPNPQNRENLAITLSALRARPARWRGDGSFEFDPKLFAAPCLELKSEAGPIHLHRFLPGVESYTALKQHSSCIEARGMTIAVASVEDLIRMNEGSTRTKDALHALELQALKELESLP